ncbi:MAG: HAMP domain-containing protein [Magnetococcales bacterium]|nr:CZB domain-containing protein [Magnetococcales bacterium]NGZ25433.1 HAMP domain-containing protein [Magnetococcales bacterium]
MKTSRTIHNLRFKLLFAPLLALFVVFLGSGSLISRLVDSALVANEDARIEMTSRVLQELYGQWLQRAKTQIKTVVVQPEMAEAFFVAKTEDNLQQLAEILQQGMTAAGATDAMALGKGSKVLFRHRKDGFDLLPHVAPMQKKIMDHPPISDAHSQLDGVVDVRLIQHQGGFYFLTAGPLLDVEDIVGVVVFVTPVTQSFVDQLKKEMAERFFSGATNVEVAMAQGTKVVVTTMTEGNNLPYRQNWIPLEGDAQLGLSFDTSANQAARMEVLGALGVIFLVAIGLLFTIILINANHIVNSIGSLVGFAEDIAQGNLTRNLTLQSKDEIGQLFHAIRAMAGSLGQTIRTVSLQSDTVEVCVKELADVRVTLAGDSGATQAITLSVSHENEQLHHEILAIQKAVSLASGNIDNISQRAEELSQSMHSVSQSTEKASNHVTSVANSARDMSARLGEANQHLAEINTTTNTMAHSVREMDASFKDVQKRCNDGVSEVNSTSGHAQNAQEIMSRLQQSAGEIGKVVNLISSIADQTKILALNANIEAASAGEKGKEFAVVARAVKELARQTADATKLITDRIEEIQRNTGEAHSANQQITQSIDRLHETIEGIVQSVTRQQELTQGINQGIQGVAQRMTGLASNATQLEKSAHNVARAAEDAANSTRTIAHSSLEVLEDSKVMNQQSTDAQNFVHSIVDAARRTGEASTRVRDKMREANQLSEFMQGSMSHFEKLTRVVEGTTEALRAAQAGLDVGVAPFDVQREKRYHLNWLGQLEQMLRGRSVQCTDEARIGEECSFGRWLAGEGEQQFGHLDFFADLKKAHQEAHQLLIEAVTHCQAGHMENLAHQVDKIHPTRERLFHLLDRLYQSRQLHA